MKKLDKKNIDDVFVLTPAQEGMLFHYLKNPGNGYYSEQLSLEISGEIDLKLFEKAWDFVIESNEMLRTVFRWEKLEKPVQIILKEYKCKTGFYDLSDKNDTRDKPVLDDIKTKNRRNTFDLRQVPFRVTLCKVGEKKYEFIIDNHHILYDGWSTGIILKEFFDSYHVLCKGEQLKKSYPKTSFKEFVKWLQNRDRNEQERFWRKYLEAFDTPTELPIKRKKEEMVKGVKNYSIILENNTKDKLDVFIKNNRVTPASVFYGAWGILLQKYCNSEDVIFGTTVSGRPPGLKGIEDIVGLFINTIPLRVQTTSHEKLIDTVSGIDRVLHVREEFENTPLVDIKTCSAAGAGESLFDTIFIIENYPLDKRILSRDNLLSVNAYSAVESTHYDLTVSMLLLDEIEVNFIHNPSLFAEESVVSLARHFKGIVQKILEYPEQWVYQLEIISEDEKNRVLYHFNNTEMGYPEDKTILEFFEGQVTKTPGRISIVGSSTHLSYMELNERADRLAWKLREGGVEPGTIVGIMVERSVDMLVGIFGILKAGAVYLPIAPGYPGKRIKYMLADSGAKMLVTGGVPAEEPGKLRSGDGFPDIETTILDNLELSHFSPSGLPSFPPPHLSSIAYVIYTSGSTGKPRGVLIEHKPVVNILWALHRLYPLMETDSYLLKTLYAFDVSVTELFGWFLGGGRLNILEKGGEKDPRQILNVVEKELVTHINFVPSMFNVFVEAITPGDCGKLSYLKFIFLAGETLLPEVVNRFACLNLSTVVENIYGPTEATIYTCKYSLSQWKGTGSIPIGNPLANVNVYILNKREHPQPIGVVGELYIGGAGLARGYLNNPGRTAETFKRIPCCPAAFIYRTGDLAGWRSDGNIEFLGRIDHQVKIRGFRIELEEIETRLLKHEKIKEAVVFAKEDTAGDKYLAAYFVPSTGISDTELREYLLKDLPGYMIPSYFVQLEKIPLTPTGKVDRSALPGPEVKETGGYVAPRNDIEKKLVEIWGEVLGGNTLHAPIGIDDNFFHLGGHSLKATSLVSRIHKKFNVKIPLGEIYKRPTIRGFSGCIDNAAGERYTGIEPVEEKEYYSLSSAQKRFYFLHQMDKDGTAYNMSSGWICEGMVDKNHLEQSLAKLIRRHESLRTSFGAIDEGPIQRIHENVEFEIEYCDLAANYADFEGDNIHPSSFLNRRFVRPFDLSRAPLLRVGLEKVAEAKHLLMVDLHHIISDGISTEILVHEFISLYREKELPALSSRYKDYTEWQNRLKQGENFLTQEKYWEKEFEGEIPVLELPLDYARPVVRGFDGARMNFEISRETVHALKVLALDAGATPYMVLISLYAVFLAKISCREDIVIGTPVGGRRYADLEKIIGVFVNTLALRIYPGGERKFIDLLAEVKNKTLQSFENQDYPYEDLVEQVAINRDTSRNPLFDTLFVLQNTGIGEIDIPGVKLTPYNLENKTSKFDLTLAGVEIEGQLEFAFEYSTKLFKPATIERFITYFKSIVSGVIKDKYSELSSLEIITGEEKRRILFDFNDTEREYPKDQTIHQIFEEQVERSPDRIAVVGAAPCGCLVCLTYRELNNRSIRLAHLLIEKGVEPDTIVGVMMERSVEMIVGILGILKSGGAYMPIDPDYPEERVEYMLKDSGAKLMVTTGNLANLPSYPLGFLPSNLPNPSNLAYIIYTSGSTGRPKGVLVEHRSVVNLICNQYKYFNLNRSDRILQFSSICFDASVEQIFIAFSSGAVLVLIDKSILPDIEKFDEFVSRYQVSHIHAVPSFLNNIHLRNASQLKRVVTGGDVCPVSLAEKWNVGFDFYNKYGPTETTVTSIEILIKDTSAFSSRLPVGKPIGNTIVYLLDRWMKPVPLGVIGELYIGGSGVARGYLNRPELTVEKFVTMDIEPHMSHKSYRSYISYRTGDLARWLPDGNIEFLGRTDFQVKIRGFRIELGEIEHRLSNHGEIKESVVLAREEEKGDKYLCAYIVSDSELLVTKLRDYLAKELPDYMLPSYFVRLEKIPLTPNGKIDRKALPDPEIKIGVGYTAPRNKVEEKLVEIWSDALGLENEVIGIDSNFFELGGHSLKATSLASRIYKEFNVKIPLGEIFKCPTIRRLFDYINGAVGERYIRIEPVEEKEYYMLSSAQKRLYFLHQMDKTGTAYNISAAWILEGIIDNPGLEQSFAKLIRRHESLRTSFVIIAEEPVQQILMHEEFKIEKYDLAAKDTKGREGDRDDPARLVNKVAGINFIRPFDLSKAPLLRVGLIKIEEDKHILVVDMHHIISDGISTGILVREFKALYTGDELPAISLRYNDYAEWQNRLKQGENFLRQKEYWRKEFEDEIPVLELPTDYARPAVQNFEGNRINFAIGRETADALNSFALETGTTLYMVLLALYSFFLSKVSSQQDIVIGSPVGGRRYADLEKVIGMFVNTLALRNHPEGEKNFTDFLGEVKEKTLEAFENQDYQYEDLVEQAAVNRDTSRNPLFDAMFVLQNMGVGDIDIPGLKLAPYDLENKTSKFDLTLTGVEIEGKLAFSFEYCTKLFKPGTIERFITYFKNIVSGVLEDKHKNLSDLVIITVEERKRILYEFNRTAAEYPENKTIHEMFEEQAARTPFNIAVIEPSIQITYGELNEKSNRLAHVLQTKGVGPDTNPIVGIMVERSVVLIIGILGILKAGGAYLPIDSQYPEDRIKYMLADSGAGILLIEDSITEATQFTQFTQFTQLTQPRHLAYVIYTSGSTGRPKGVMVDHMSVVNLLFAVQKEYPFGGSDTYLLKTSFVFDVSVTELFGWYLGGGKVTVLEKGGEKDPRAILDLVERNRVSHINFVSSMFNAFLEHVTEENKIRLAGLKYIFLAGEALLPELVKKFRALNTPIELENIYGPTEGTVYSSKYSLSQWDGIGSVPIGKPFPNTRLYILDRYNHLQPLGAAGELVICGSGLARGYLNNPELTAEKFGLFTLPPAPPDLCPLTPKLYKTGDLCRWLPDGNIEFLGRIDHQVKIRGFRIELGEIENQLLKHKDIKEAVLVVNEDGVRDKSLTAYIVSTRELLEIELREYLLKKLPGYMIPSYFVPLKKIPLTPNGKIDRKALPKPEFKVDESYTAPRDEIEKKLVEIWSKVFSRDELHAYQLQTSIGIDDNFFQLGGHSLKASVMIAKVHKALHVEIPLARVFETPIIRELSGYIKETGEKGYDPIERVLEREYYELSSAQKRLYFLQQLDLNSTSYNMSMALSLGQGIKKDKLQYALKQLIARHESLRTSIKRVNKDLVQVIHPAESIEFSLDYYEAGKTGIKEIIKSYIRSFDLSRAPLIRSGVITLPDGYCIWMVDIHHIVSDGTSLTILAEDFMQLYETGTPLEPLPVQYKDFTHWQNQLFASGRIKNQEDYWLQLYSGEIPCLNLVADYKRPGVFTFEGDCHVFTLEREDAVKFKALGARFGGTLYMNMMAVLNTLFYKYTGQTDIIIGSGIAGRRHADIQGVVGMFVNTLAIRNYPTGEKSYEYFLKEVIANSVKGFENQDVQFEELVDKLNPERDPSRNPLFDILIVVQNFREVDSNISLEQLRAVDENSSAYGYKNTTAKFDLAFFVQEQGDDVFINIQYYTGIFTSDTIRRLVSQFKCVVKTVIEEPGIKLKEIAIISEEEKQQVLYEINHTARDYPRDKSIPALFEEQVERAPDHIALVGATPCVCLTYRELNERSSRLANYLYYGNRVESDQPVGIMMDRSLEMISALLGILKAGGGYVPISPSYPPARIKQMIYDAGIRILLSQKRYIKILNRLQWECGTNVETFLCIDSHDVYKEEEAEENQLMSRKLWEYVGESAVDEVTGGGWNSSYTGEPIPKEEMDEYGDNILKKLEPLLHTGMRVLEIGIASGISMYRIAPQVGLYYGTDLSQVIIEKNSRRIIEEGHKNIKLQRAAAHEIDRLDEKDFDLVIINSVIQCFHGHNYFRDVIRKAIDRMGSWGYLFIGDIMDQDLKEDLIADLLKFKQVHGGTHYKTKVDWSEELFISRSFLESLAWDYPEIYDLEFSNKIHTLENELTRFRYDALIKIDRSGKERKRIKPNRHHKTCHDLRILRNFGAGKIGFCPNGENLAYIIYTSGSTGVPKGVMVEHRNVVRLVKNTNFIEFKSGDRILQTGALEFDASTLEIWGALLNGFVLTLENKESLLEVGILKEIIAKNKITVMWMTSSFFNRVLDEDVEVFGGLRCLLVGGEVLSSSHINRLRARFPGLYVINGYGPTENTTFSTTFLIDKEYTENIPIGRPIANSTAYVLDRDRNLQPPGLPGELYAGGDGIARGYLNSPELTAERFISFSHELHELKRINKSFWGSRDHFAKRSLAAGGIFYKTGDSARFLPDGNIEFLGRIDQQVKIRGYRIELGEIENRLSKHPGTKEVVVLDRTEENGDKHLYAYIVSDGENVVSELREYLSKELPDYMIPSYFVQLEKIPLTPNGKIDRGALPKPELKVGESYTAPRDEIEKKLVGLWSQILCRDALHASQLQTSIGIDDNFFESGGHSLRAMALVSRIRKEFNVEFPLNKVFSDPTVKAFSRFIKNAQKSIFKEIEPVGKKEYYPSSSAQKRLFFLAHVENIGFSYNIPTALNVVGNMDKPRFERAIKDVIQRHEALRTSFHLIGNEPVQRIHNEVEFEIEYDNLAIENTGEEEIKIDRFIRPFDLSRAPLLRVQLVTMPDHQHLLLYDMHHIIGDGTSSGLLADDFIRLYAGEKLQPLKIQYKDFSCWQNRLFESGGIKAQEEYWINLYAGEIPRLNLPTDYPRPAVFSFAGGSFGFTLGSEDAARFKQLGLTSGTTLYMNLLAAFKVLLYKYTGQDDIIVGGVIAGRRHADLQHIIGMFVNTLAIRNHPRGHKTFLEFLKEVKENSLKAFENQDVQFEELVAKLELERDPSRNPLFDVCFVMQNFEQLHADLEEMEQVEGVVFSPYAVKNKISQFDLTIDAFERAGEIQFKLEYCTTLFNHETPRGIAHHFVNIINQIAVEPGTPLSDIDLMTEDEKRRILYDFNDTEREYPNDKTIHQLFEDQVEKTPDSMALVGASPCGGPALSVRSVYLTYRELNEKSNRLAHYLHDEKDTCPGAPVGLMMDRSVDGVIAILGILKAGCAYVPIDPSLPRERMRTIINDAGIKVVLSQGKYNRLLNVLQWECPTFAAFLCIDSRNIYLEEDEERGAEKELEQQAKLWEFVGETASDEITGGGWISSYTGVPLSVPEMEEYGNNILEKLSPLLHKQLRVLEIGCASGISMFRIAPQVGFYYGTDLSRTIIEKNRERVKWEGHTNIALACLPAHQIEGLAERDFDLVIINSVIQDFPGHNYLRRVIRSAVGLLREKGRLFVGDVMDQDLKEKLTRDLSAFKRENRDKKYKTKTDFSMDLFVSRAFFNDLRIEIPELRQVEFSGKIFTIENELTRYRYDVLIEVDKIFPPGKAVMSRNRYQDDGRSVEKFPVEKLSVHVPPSQLAYVLYTSGSTGLPKGVMVEHRGVVNLVHWFGRAYGLQAGVNLLQLTGYSFDPSVEDIFSTLVHGASLYVVSRSLLGDMGRLREFIRTHRIHIIDFIPTLLKELLCVGEKPGSLRVVISGGERLEDSLKDRFLAMGYRLYNHYGPTEVTVDALVSECSHDKVTLGVPIANTQCFILDRDNNAAAPGVPGELCISGLGLARGYLNSPELTTERFISFAHELNELKQINKRFGKSGNPFPKKFLAAGGILYRTGDLARWLADGNIEFLGRIDKQLKIRGYRIELGEIEKQLLKHDAVKEAVVTASSPGGDPESNKWDEPADKLLCAYIVSDGEVDTVELREYLLSRMPDYMVPSYFVQLEKIPLTSNGKINPGALPNPELKAGESYTAPRDEIEKKLVGLWSEILGRDALHASQLQTSIGIDDNFFESGGHSLRAMALVSRIRKEFNVEFPLNKIFSDPTVKAFSHFIENAQKSISEEIKPVEKREYYILSSTQKGIYIVQQMDLGSTAFNTPVILELEGEIEKEKLENTFLEVIDRHESLRTSFEVVEDEPVQRVHHKVDFECEYFDFSAENPGGIGQSEEITIEEITNAFIRPFDLSRAPLLRVSLLKKKEQKHILMVDIHHIISDETSTIILINDFKAIYEGQKLPPIKIQYKDFSEWQNSAKQGNTIKRQEEYWLKQFEDKIPGLNLPIDYDRTRVQDFEGDSIYFEIDCEMKQALMTLAQEKGATLFMVLLAIWNILLGKICGQEDVVVGTPIEGRRYNDLNHVMGLFVNMLVLRNYPWGEKTFKELVEDVKIRTIDAFENQDYQFEDMVNKIAPAREAGRMPLVDVLIQLQNRDRLELELDLPGVKMKHYEFRFNISKFDMNLIVFEKKETLEFKFLYKTKLFNENSIKKLIESFILIISQVIGNPEIKISEIQLIREEEENQFIKKTKDDTGGKIEILNSTEEILADFDF